MPVIRLLSSAIASAILALGTMGAMAQDASSDPPDRVVRLSYQTGDVEYAAAGDDQWGLGEVNRPLLTGDRLDTGADGRAALELGSASVRINHDSAFSVLDLDSSVAQFELTQGALNLRVRRMDQGQTYEVDTPNLAFVAGRPGNYRFDVLQGGRVTILTVYSGDGTVYGEGGVSLPVAAGRSYRIADTRLENTIEHPIAAPDDFYVFIQARELRREHSIAARYVSPDMIGSDDLDDNGDWNESPEYGAVWYPRHVARNWAPYHDGHWAWVDPWGWTWVDNAPWGFAPSHYGRWAWVGNRWGWLPGPRTQRAVYAPALVAFVGGSHLSLGVSGGGEPVGWFPLGPRDVYQPPYRVTRNYFTNINVTNVKVVNTTVINNVYNNYTSNQPVAVVYANRNVAGAVTVVPRNVFTGARPVAAATIKVNPEELAKATVTPVVRVAPTIESAGVKPAVQPGGAPNHIAQPPEHAVIARHAPAAAPVPFAERVKAVADQGGKPLAPAQLHDLGNARPAAHAPHVMLASPNGAIVPSAKEPAPVAGAKAPTPAAADASKDKGKSPDGVVAPTAAANPAGHAPHAVTDPANGKGRPNLAGPAQRPHPTEPANTKGKIPAAPEQPSAAAHPADATKAVGNEGSGAVESTPARTPPVAKPVAEHAASNGGNRSPRPQPANGPMQSPQVQADQGTQQPLRKPSPANDANTNGATPATPARPTRQPPAAKPPVDENGNPALTVAPRPANPTAGSAQHPHPAASNLTPEQMAAAQKRKDDKAIEDQKKKDQQEQQH